jgi:hypothetical protein
LTLGYAGLLVEIQAYAIMERGAVATPFTYTREIGAHDVLVAITHRSITTGDERAVELRVCILQCVLLPERHRAEAQLGNAERTVTEGVEA